MGSDRHPGSLDPENVISSLTDAGTFSSWDDDTFSMNAPAFAHPSPYTNQLLEARKSSYGTESIITGRADIAGHPTVLIVGDFSFIAGSIGITASERLCRAFERAAQDKLPVVAITSSAGTRMQEGSLGFVQMIKITQSIRDFRREGLPYIVYLANPTLGGVLASWGSLGHVTFAAPNALIGLTGPRVVALTETAPLPFHVQKSEHLRQHGLLDDILPLTELKKRLSRLLRSLEPPSPPMKAADLGNLSEQYAVERVDPWQCVRLSRDKHRPAARELIGALARDITYLRGDRAGGGDDSACITAIARVADMPVIMIAQDRSHAPEGARMTVSGYRKALRAIACAGEMRLPLLTIIDTPGAELSISTEEEGLAGTIATCLYELLGLSTPTISILLGEGGGGGALALLPADRIVAAQHSWLSPMRPEGASVVLYGSAAEAVKLARDQAIAAWQLQQLGIVDIVVPELPSASDEGEVFLSRMAKVVSRGLLELTAAHDEERLARRTDRYRNEARSPS